MPKIQPCRNGCGTDIVVQMDTASGKYKPYVLNEQNDEWDIIHNCPKSPYNTNRQQGGNWEQKKTFAAKPPQQTQVQYEQRSSSGYSQGGATLDQKRERVMMEELGKKMDELMTKFTLLQNAVVSIQ